MVSGCVPGRERLSRPLVVRPLAVRALDPHHPRQREFLAYDPCGDLSRIKVPMLAPRPPPLPGLTLNQVETAESADVESNLHSIGELARASGLTVSALRFYDGAGVLIPAVVDSATGYRWYAEHQLRSARLVAGLRRVGMPLAEITDLLARCADPVAVRRLLGGCWWPDRARRATADRRRYR